MTEPDTTSGPTDGVDAPLADPVLIIGAGPAGLTAAHQLVGGGDPVVVVEEDSVVGGISRTVERDGWRFDIGGHRFFTKVKPVEEFWHTILPPEDFLLRPRMSRIYYGGKFYDYPIKSGQRPLQPRGHRGGPLRTLVPVGPDPSAEGPDHPGGLHRLQLRLASLRPLLQDLQREGLGRPGLGALR